MEAPYFKDTWRVVMSGIETRVASLRLLWLHLLFPCISGQGHPLTHLTCEATLLRQSRPKRVLWGLHQAVYLSQQLAYCTPQEFSEATPRLWRQTPTMHACAVCLLFVSGPTNLPSTAQNEIAYLIFWACQDRDFSQGLNQEKSFSWRIGLFLADDFWTFNWPCLGWLLRRLGWNL